MNLTERTVLNFRESIEAKIVAQERLAEQIAEGASTIVGRLLEGGKVLACGNGGSASNALHFASQMVNRFERERPGLPAIALGNDAPLLSSIASDYDFDEVYAKQVRVLGQAGDLLLAISTQGESDSVNAAVEAAHEREMSVIALTGRDGGRMADLLRHGDAEIRVPAERDCRVQEVHLLVIHCLLDLVDQQLLGHE